MPGGERIEVRGEVIRILPSKELRIGDEIVKVVDLIIADESDYKRISLWDEKAELVTRGEIRVGDVLQIENAYIAGERPCENRANAGRYTTIRRISEKITALSNLRPMHLTVLAVARPEKGRVCIAGINERGEWIRPQGVYEKDAWASESGVERFRNLCISRIYVDAWHGRHPRREDRFFIYGAGIERQLSEEEKREFLERHLDESVDAVFKSGRTLGLIKPRILRVYEVSAAGTGTGRTATGKDKNRTYETYIRFNFRDSNGRIYRGWSCRCSAFYKLWNEFKHRHRLSYRWRIHRLVKKNETYLAIGLTYTDYGTEGLEYRAYPMIVGVHIIKPISSVFRD